jgi:hypothetical protein
MPWFKRVCSGILRRVACRSEKHEEKFSAYPAEWKVMQTYLQYAKTL